MTTQFALEGAPASEHSRIPGLLYASFPIFDTRDAAEFANGFITAQHPDLPPARILTRVDGGPWEVAS